MASQTRRTPGGSDAAGNKQNANIAEHIYEDLVARILSDEIPAGSRLSSERELATRYGTNRNTLREAIRKIEHARLVSVRHGQGVTVSDFRRTGTVESLGPFLVHAVNPGERVRVLVDLLVARARVLEMAVAMAAERAEDDDVERIEQLVERQQIHFAAGDHEALLQTDIDLIDAVIDAAHSLTVRWFANTLIDVYQGLVERTSAMWVFHPSFPEYLDALSTSIAAGDADAAVAATRTYYDAVDQKLLEVLEALVPQARKRSERAMRRDQEQNADLEP